MAPELPEVEIRRVVRERLREGMLWVISTPIPAATAATGRDDCIVCGFPIGAGRKECAVSGARAHEICATIWLEESPRAR